MRPRKGGKAVNRERRGSEAARAAHGSPRGGSGAVRLHLIARDPHCLFATWRLLPVTGTNSGQGATGAPTDRGRLVLRLYDVTPLPSASRRPVQFFVGTRKSFYIRVPGDGRRYRAELGWAAGSAFVSLARSRTVETPPAGPAPAGAKGAPALAAIHPGPAGSLPSSRTVPARPEGPSRR